MAKTMTASDVDAFMRQLKILIAGVIAVMVAPLLIYAVYLDRRMDSFENSLRYRPAEEIAEYVADGHVHQSVLNPMQGQVVYVPAYSHIYHQDGSPYLLTITLSVRNTSVDREIFVKSVRYFDTKGKEVKSYLAKPLRLPPLATTEFLVARSDATGGSGANFLVEWVSNEEVAEPIIEAVMIDTEGKQGLSFARSGRAVSEVVPTKTPMQETKDEDASMLENRVESN